MRYIHSEGVKQTKKSRGRSYLVFGGFLVVACLYAGGLLLWPALPVTSAEVQSVTDVVKNNRPNSSSSRLYIPKLGLAAKINDSKPTPAGLTAVTKTGNPASGGNYVLNGNKLDLGLTPGLTAERSPLYHIDELAVGDDIFVDYHGQRYNYKIDSKQTVAANDESFSTPTTDPTLTLYTRSSGILTSSRSVIFAHPVGVVTWVDGRSGLKAL